MDRLATNAVSAALEQRPGSCWERMLDAADELVEVHGVPVEEVIARIRLAFASGNEHHQSEEARVFFNQAWPG